ncbi:OLC1v1011596C1 [Oldenlandia corymbosa var. corymbosa]|uniref:OLC1v1011596C1 n=1 Tax=Oldenlandia corymbosa var. corymbosa TaxID=529605 RepID=A0AAV1DUK9_OLDCO|nr:OLC1v1011596C1 [Oldenlandia corymbosa var. corymbosa]
MAGQIHGLWVHLPLLVRANSKDSVEYILQALWRTRKTGLDAADRQIFRQMLQLENDSELDPLLVCLRIIIRRCVYEGFDKEDIHKLFPSEVLPELQRLLTLLLQKFHKEWQEDVLKDQVLLETVVTKSKLGLETSTTVRLMQFELLEDAGQDVFLSACAIRRLKWD